MMLLSIFLSLLGLTYQDLYIREAVTENLDRQPIVDIYDFEADGLYYAYLSDSTVQVIRKRTFYHINSGAEGAFYWGWDYADERMYEFEDNFCYTGDIVIPDTVQYNDKTYRVVGINPYALCYSPGLSSIVVGQQEVVMGMDHCKSLKSVKFKSAVSAIDAVCHSCDSLINVEIPEGVTRLYNSFAYCYSLKQLEIPNSVTHFVNMGGLRGSDTIDFKSRDGVRHPKTTVEEWFLSWNDTVKRMIFPECDTLQLLKTHLYEAENLEEVRYRDMKVFVKHDWELLGGAYRSGNDKGRVVSESKTPPEVIVSSQDYQDSFRDKIILYVPDESVEAYRTAPYWEEFKEVRSMTQYDEEMAAAMIGVSSDTTDATLTCTSLGTTLSVECPIATSLDIWTMQGQRVWHGDIAPGAPASVNLPHDIYILTANGHSIKVRH